jgi:GTPase SAR1 family protein
MSIKIKRNQKPDIPICKMTCDGGLHDRLNKYDLTEFMNCHSTTLMIGRPGSGKTSLLWSMFKSKELLNRVYHNIYLFQPSASAGSMKDNIFKDLDNKYDELNADNLGEVFDNLNTTPSDENSVIIFDDQTAHLKDKGIVNILKEIVYNRRHLHTSLIFCCQTYMAIPRDIRKLFSNIFLFKCSKKEMETIFDEVVEENKDDFLAVSKCVFDKKFNFLFINVDSGRLFKNWDELILPKN